MYKSDLTTPEWIFAKWAFVMLVFSIITSWFKVLRYTGAKWKLHLSNHSYRIREYILHLSFESTRSSTQSAATVTRPQVFLEIRYCYVRKRYVEIGKSNIAVLSQHVISRHMWKKLSAYGLTYSLVLWRYIHLFRLSSCGHSDVGWVAGMLLTLLLDITPVPYISITIVLV